VWELAPGTPGEEGGLRVLRLWLAYCLTIARLKLVRQKHIQEITMVLGMAQVGLAQAHLRYDNGPEAEDGTACDARVSAAQAHLRYDDGPEADPCECSGWGSLERT